METDALLILALAALVWQLGKTGPWILAAGAMRYAFVAAGLVWPRLRGRLPPSRRRQTICVAQIAALMVCLAPFVPPDLSGPLGLLSVTLLAVSFALDVAWLARRSQG
jgi:phosphatidylglycerophosphate synthase